jgi:hypothetical protein
LKYAGDKATNPVWYWRFLSDDDPRPRATLAQQRVELGVAYGDDAAVGEGDRPACGIHRGRPT